MSELVYDVFISYSSRDAAWVRGELLRQLEAGGLRVCIGERDFVPGVPSVREMERAVESSRHTLLVLSPDYLKSEWAAFETLMLQTLDPANQQRRLIPLLHTPCDLPLRLRPFTHIDFTTSQDWERLRDALGPPVARKTPDEMPLDALPPHAALPPGSWMPLSRNQDFVGRERELLTLATVLQGGATAAINPVAATMGLGGIGKTQLASEFAHRYGQFFPGGVFWLSFADAAGVRSEIARCGGLDCLNLRPDFSDLKLDDQVRLVIAAWHQETARLLIFDNCEDEALLAEYRPKYGGCRVLVTSRRDTWSRALNVQPLPLETLQRPESIELLCKHRPDLTPDDRDLDALAHYLGDLPLALHVAGSYLALYKTDLSPADYLAELQKAGGIDVELLSSEEISATGHKENVWRTFERSYNQLDATNNTDRLALRLLARAAHCAPGEPLPRDLLIATAGIDPDNKKARRPATRAIKRLGELGLIESDEEETLRLHRLLAAYVRAVADDAEAQVDVEQTLFDVAYQVNKEGDPRSLISIQPQLRAVTDAARGRLDEHAAILCNEMGCHFDMMGDFAAARPLYERALAIFEQVLGPTHPHTASSLNNLGYLLHTMGDFAAARPLYKRALTICEQTLGPTHPDTAQSLNNLGSLLHAQGDFVAARPYIERALVIYEQALGPNHPDTAESLNNLGYLLHTMGDFAAARPYIERALTIFEQTFGSSHPHTAQTLNNLGYLLHTMGDFAAAQPLFARSLVIREQVLGPTHPHTAQSLNNLGSLLHAQGDFAAARPYIERALAIREQTLGPTHPDTAESLNNLGSLLHAQGDFAAARPYIERALVIYEQVFGPDHPHTRLVRSNLAGLDAPPQSNGQQIATIE